MVRVVPVICVVCGVVGWLSRVGASVLACVGLGADGCEFDVIVLH